MGIDSQVCFHRGLFSSLSNRERAPQGLWSHWMALIRMCVVSNCSQPLSRPILWIVAVCATYRTHSTAVRLLMVGLTRLRLPTHPRHPHHPCQPPTPTTHPPPPPPSHPPTPATPLPPTHPLILAIRDITVTVKKVAQKPAVLAS